MGDRRLSIGPVGPGSTFSILAAAQAALDAERPFALVLPTQAAKGVAMLNRTARRLATFYAPYNRLLGTLMRTVQGRACAWCQPERGLTLNV